MIARRGTTRPGVLIGALVLVAAGLATGGPPAAAAAPDRSGAAPVAATPAAERVTVDQRVAMADGVEVHTTLSSAGPVRAKPTVVEFTPYGDGAESLEVGPEYNFLLVHIRGTGDSDGSCDALGPASQSDVVEVLRWACAQSFSDGRLALNGYSASAIVAYNTWHTELPCVKAAVMKSGTHELYRDLLVPGGVMNLLPGAGVIAMIGAPALLQGVDRLRRDPASALDVVGGLFSSGLHAALLHPTLDRWWSERGWRGDANDIPVLMINGFFDVESRGAFQAFQALRDDGAHLVMEGGHDGVPVNTDGAKAEAAAWLDHFVRGVENGIEDEAPVRLTIARGDRGRYLDGDNVSVTGQGWPLPGTAWVDLALTGGKGLALQAPAGVSRKSYLTVPSLPTMTDVPNIALVDAGGARALTGALPLLTQTGLASLDGLTGQTFTSAALATDVDLIGPVTLDLPLATTTPGSGIWAVLSDVAPDGSSHPLTVGRLSTTFPGVVEERSLRDSSGRSVQPYGDYARPDPARSGETRRYQVELWPVGNRFARGHRLRIQLVGSSGASIPVLPGLHSVVVGGPEGARLRVPVAPGSDLVAALR